MIEVIEIGKQPPVPTFTEKCFNCNSTVKFTQFDGVVSHCPRTGSCVVIVCPVCGARIDGLLTRPATVIQLVRPNQRLPRR